MILSLARASYRAGTRTVVNIVFAVFFHKYPLFNTRVTSTCHGIPSLERCCLAQNLEHSSCSLGVSPRVLCFAVPQLPQDLAVMPARFCQLSERYRGLFLSEYGCIWGVGGCSRLNLISSDMKPLSTTN